VVDAPLLVVQRHAAKAGRLDRFLHGRGELMSSRRHGRSLRSESPRARGPSPSSGRTTALRSQSAYGLRPDATHGMPVSETGTIDSETGSSSVVVRSRSRRSPFPTFRRCPGLPAITAVGREHHGMSVAPQMNAGACCRRCDWSYACSSLSGRPRESCQRGLSGCNARHLRRSTSRRSFSGK
jgi:hypothetical protein